MHMFGRTEGSTGFVITKSYINVPWH